MRDTKGTGEERELSFAEQLNLADNAEKRKEELGKQELEKIKKELQGFYDEMYKEFIDELYESVKKAIMEKVKKKEYITKKDKKIVSVDIKTVGHKRLPKDLMASFEKRVMKYDMFCHISRYKTRNETGNVVDERIDKYIRRDDFAKALDIRYVDDYESANHLYYLKQFGHGVTRFKPIIIMGKETLPKETIDILDRIRECLRTDNIVFSGIINYNWGKPSKLLFRDYKKARISTDNHGFHARFTMEF